MGQKKLALWDGPGTGSHEDGFKHSSVIRNGLECEMLNAIFVVIPFHVRACKMIECYVATTSMLKDEYMHMVVPIISKMNQFVPDGNIKTVKGMEDNLKAYFAA